MMSYIVNRDKSGSYTMKQFKKGKFLKVDSKTIVISSQFYSSKTLLLNFRE